MSTQIDSADELDPETLARLPSFVTPRISPDGSEVAFFHDRSGRMEVYVASTADASDPSTWTRLSDGNVPRNPRGALHYDTDGEEIFFHRDEDGDEQNDVYRLDRDGTATPVIETDGQSFLVDTASDGTLVYVSDHGEQLNLYAFDREAGESTRLTTFEQPVRPGPSTLSPDEERIAFACNESENLQNRDVYVAARDGSDRRRLDVGEDGAEASAVDWFPDGERLLVDDNSTDRSRVGVYDLDADTVEWLSDGTTEETADAVLPGGDAVLVTRTRRAAEVPVVYDLAGGESRELDVSEGVVSLAASPAESFLDETTVALQVTTGDSRSELVAYDLTSDETRTLLPADYGDVDPDVFVAPEYVRYESEDGTEIGALLYESPTAESPAPAVVKVHGGPSVQAQHSFDVYTQFLVSQGYTVLEPNYRGSTGRGREFKNAIDGDWGGMEQVDVRCGAEWLAAERDVDPDRRAVLGASYGGYSAYCQLTMHPEPWAAGVAWIGMTDLLQLYEDSMPHFKSALERYLGDPEENEALYRERSPITHVENVEAPIGILHGVNDPRCPISQARLFRDALEDRGWSAPEDFAYHELGEEGHGSADQDQKARAFELIAEFLDDRL
ncbi:prolyl oligopeptidase family serine peptidase [Halobaculum sp. MBLA0147]|uniref:S9 family peptidase n=1 Tax=Halobaculum sp. MBLA0147 TaxID=3079934 RepID=UPI0035247612